MFGFRLWKITSGIIGFIFGFFITYFLVLRFARRAPPCIGSPHAPQVMYFMGPNTANAVWIGLGAGIGAGLLVGIFLFFFPVVSLVVISLFIGCALGVLLYNVAFIHTGWVYAYYISVGVSALVVMILALIIKKTFIVLMTAFYGAFAIAYGINVYVGGFPIFIIDATTGTRVRRLFVARARPLF